jgi:hypothetical protein
MAGKVIEKNELTVPDIGMLNENTEESLNLFQIDLFVFMASTREYHFASAIGYSNSFENVAISSISKTMRSQEEQTLQQM